MRFISGLMVSFCLSSMALAAPAVLFDEVEVGVKPTHAPSQTSWNKDQVEEIVPLSQRSTWRVAEGGQEFSDAFEMRAQRRVGVGMAMAGQLGLAGAVIELGFRPEDSMITGFGGGPGYQSMTFQWKHLFGGTTLTPYSTLGYSYWYSSSKANKSLDQTSPVFLKDRFLTEDEVASGQFSRGLFAPSLGVQYHQLNGPLVGTSLFAEIVVLMSLSEMRPVPTGNVGALFYF